jgi:uncharacterized repeat protein (TIGR03943 family)
MPQWDGPVKSPDEHLKRWLNPFVFAAWTLFLIYLLISQRYAAFLRPEFGLLLALAHLIALGFTLTAMVRSLNAATDNASALRSLILLMPILYSMIMPDTMLGHQAFNKRFTGNTSSSIKWRDQSGNSSQSAENGPETPMTQEDSENENGQPKMPQERTILELLMNPKLHSGQRVIVTGMILNDAQLKSYFGGRETAVYRFLITCCAADALPLAIALDSEHIDDVDNDQWVQVEGVFELKQIDGKPVPMVAAPQIRKIEAPAVPYLF